MAIPGALPHDQLPPVLSARKRLILKAIVESYIGSATPVGSGQVVREYVPDVSSATVRNEMVGLEEAGLLTQPHTSAGRVPSEGGFRYFRPAVDGGAGADAGRAIHDQTAALRGAVGT